MARVNVGINPKHLSDAHLIAECVEITMITGQLRSQKSESKIPNEFSLGKGHMNFFKNKLLYLYNRLSAIKEEMKNRGFKCNTEISLVEFDKSLYNDWRPTLKDSKIVRERIVERLKNPLRLKRGHRYYKNYIDNINEFTEKLKNSELFRV